MDYPHPKVTHENGEVDFSEAYAVGIGEWDKIAVTYGYASSPQELSEKDFLKGLIKTHQDNGYKYITDQDARPQGGIHPLAHLWDNGSSAIEELNRIMNLRRHTLNNFDASVLPSETPYSELEKVIVPVYLMHRYQVEAAAKLIAGSYFSYSVYPEEENELKKVNKQVQSEALSEILNTLDESSLAFPPKALSLINPPAYGYPRDRETFKGKTGARFDDTAAAESWIGFVFSLLLNPERLARIERGDFPNMSLSNYLDKIDQHVQSNGGRYAKLNQKVLYIKILELINKSSLDITVKSHLMNKLNRFIDRPSLSTTREYITHHDFIRGLRDSLLESPSTFDLPGIQNLPPGSPIGCYGK